MSQTGKPPYVVLIERSADGFGAWAPDLPGCVAVAETPDACEEEMRAAIAFHLDGLRDAGAPVPEPSTRAALVAT